MTAICALDSIAKWMDRRGDSLLSALLEMRDRMEQSVHWKRSNLPQLAKDKRATFPSFKMQTQCPQDGLLH